jgi:NAD(P)H dehydrogenase (quinone)
MKAAILYFSKSGRTKQAASLVAEGMRAAAPCEVRLFELGCEDGGYLAECDAVVFGTPTYYANIAWQVKRWFDESWGCSLAGKLGAVFATANYQEGGADIALLTLISHLMVKGMLVYSGGSALGQPYFHLGAVALGGISPQEEQKFRLFGERVAQKASFLFNTEKIHKIE